MDKSLITLDTIDNILVVNFKVNALSADVFSKLNSILDDIEQSTSLKGVVFTSDSDKIFLAGANLFELEDLITKRDTKTLRAVIRRGQQTYQRIENLNIPTAAAIHGMCLGGGLELALACDLRIASVDKNTKLGLPEVTLGILPAWGGTTRLIRLLSLPNALKVLLTGNQFSTKPAHRMGLIHKMAHRENIVQASISLMRVHKSSPPKTSLLHKLLPDSLVLNKATTNTLRKTNGNYPAPLTIIEVVESSLSMTPAQSMLLEENAFIELTETSEMKNLLRIFFLQEKSKKLLADDTKPARVNNAVVVGAGTMGSGITQWLSSRGLHVTLKDINDNLISKGLKNIGDLYVKGVLSHRFDRPTAKRNLSRIYTATDNIPLHNKDILIEAIVEDLDIKQKVLAQLEEKLSNDAIIATNTSALSIDDMAACLKRPERFVGIHFFNPVHQMKLVEVVRGKKTSDSTIKRAVEFVQQIGKLPIVVNDSPGFVVNRILIPYLVKAVDLTYDHPPAFIDAAMVDFGMPMGPFRLMDEIGLDVCYHVADDLNRRLDLNCSLEEILWRVESNRLGKKTGQGFYTYKKGYPVKRKVSGVVDVTPLINTMTEEAQKVIDEGVIDDPDMLDFAMIMGTGWAPFRGGPLAYRQQLTVEY